jgi:hypothetical protein
MAAHLRPAHRGRIAQRLLLTAPLERKTNPPGPLGARLVLNRFSCRPTRSLSARAPPCRTSIGFNVVGFSWRFAGRPSRIVQGDLGRGSHPEESGEGSGGQKPARCYVLLAHNGRCQTGFVRKGSAFW